MSTASDRAEQWKEDVAKRSESYKLGFTAGMEEAARISCFMCGNWTDIFDPAILINGEWLHPVADNKSRYSRCEAAAIRTKAAEKAEQ